MTHLLSMTLPHIRTRPLLAAGLVGAVALGITLIVILGGSGPSTATARQIDAFHDSTETCLAERTTAACAAPYDHLHDIAQSGWCRDETSVRAGGYRGFHACPESTRQ